MALYIYIFFFFEKVWKSWKNWNYLHKIFVAMYSIPYTRRNCIRKTIAKKQKSRQINLVKCRKSTMQQHASKFWQLEKLKTPFTCLSCCTKYNSTFVTWSNSESRHNSANSFLGWWLWQYGFSNFQERDTKLESFWPKHQHTVKSRVLTRLI